MRHIATFCGSCSCGCPELYVDDAAPPERRVVITDDFGQLLYDNVSMEAWQMWLKEAPRYVNTYGLDLQTQKGRDFLREQMRIFFGFDEGKLADTAWVPPEKR